MAHFFKKKTLLDTVTFGATCDYALLMKRFPKGIYPIALTPYYLANPTLQNDNILSQVNR